MGYRVMVRGQVLKKKIQNGYGQTNRRMDGLAEYLCHFLSCS
jgi:hypothetical protein